MCLFIILCASSMIMVVDPKHVFNIVLIGNGKLLLENTKLDLMSQVNLNMLE